MEEMTKSDIVVKTLQVIDEIKEQAAFDFAESSKLENGQIVLETVAFQVLHRGFRMGLVYSPERSIMSLDIANVSGGMDSEWGSVLHRIEIDKFSPSWSLIEGKFLDVAKFIREKRHAHNVKFVDKMADVFQMSQPDWESKFGEEARKKLIDEKINAKRNESK